MKKSFAEIMAENEASKHNSDLSNLAYALSYAKQAKLEVEHLIMEIESAAHWIEAGEVLPLDTVRNLYNEASGRAKTRL